MLANDLNRNSNIGLVVGATAINELRIIRNLAPDLPMLIPGVGAQGGDLKESVIVGNESSLHLSMYLEILVFQERWIVIQFIKALKTILRL